MMNLYRVFGAAASLAVAAAAFAQPSNDSCSNPIAVTSGSTTSFDTTTATTDGFSDCGFESGSDIWYTFTASSDGILSVGTCDSGFDTVLSVFDGCGGNELGCSDDACGDLQSSTTAAVASGQTVYIRVAGYFGDSGFGNLSVSFEATTPADWNESGDAGETPATAQVPTGSGAFTTIQGAITDGDNADMYKITICDAGSFTATTVSAITGDQDTQLFLFDENGNGVQMDDDVPGGDTLNSFMDNSFVTVSGTYYLAVSHYDNDPLNASGNDIWEDTPYGQVRAPDGEFNGGDTAVVSWDGDGFDTFTYRITMTGVCYFDGGGCIADFNHDTVVDFFDYLDFVDAFSQNDPIADFNHDTVIDFFDYLDFVDAFSHGC